MFSGGRYREPPARCSPPRRALVPPRTEPRGANPYARRRRSHPPPDHRWRHLSRTVALARSCARALVKKSGRRGSGARSIPSSTCSSDSGAAGDGAECVGERKLEARRDPTLADGVCSSTTEVQHRALGDHAHHRPNPQLTPAFPALCGIPDSPLPARRRRDSGLAFRYRILLLSPVLARGPSPGLTGQQQLQQVCPRQASRASRSATVPISKATAGSAHHKPAIALASSPTRSAADR